MANSKKYKVEIISSDGKIGYVVGKTYEVTKTESDKLIKKGLAKALEEESKEGNPDEDK